MKYMFENEDFRIEVKPNFLGKYDEVIYTFYELSGTKTAVLSLKESLTIMENIRDERLHGIRM